MFYSTLSPNMRLSQTPRFSTYETADKTASKAYVFVDVVCNYCREIVESTINRRDWCTMISDRGKKFDSDVFQICDFELIEWEPVLGGEHHASSFIVRKGMSRKAQLSLQLKKYISKHPESAIKHAVPFSVILETWGAFDDMKVDFGLGINASLDSCGSLVQQSSLRQRMEWCLHDAKEEFTHSDREGWTWILKPSVTNKGSDISVLESWDELLDALEWTPDIREWVLQKYLTDPMTINGHKFHIRVYVLCVGALKVYVYDDMLVLVAAHKYTPDDLTDSLAHLSNTARAVEDIEFDEEKFVQRMGDFSAILLREENNGITQRDEAETITRNIKESIRVITSELYAAYENEYTIFSPMDNCFELFGLDFMVDASYGVHLLEVNPGPDVKQTGDRLRGVIASLWEDTCSIVIDGEDEGSFSRRNDFKKVYDKMWSAAAMKGGGMALK